MYKLIDITVNQFFVTLTQNYTHLYVPICLVYPVHFNYTIYHIMYINWWYIYQTNNIYSLNSVYCITGNFHTVQILIHFESFLENEKINIYTFYSCGGASSNHLHWHSINNLILKHFTYLNKSCITKNHCYWIIYQ